MAEGFCDHECVHKCVEPKCSLSYVAGYTHWLHFAACSAPFFLRKFHRVPLGRIQIWRRFSG